jgi:hypothetical protein
MNRTGVPNRCRTNPIDVSDKGFVDPYARASQVPASIKSLRRLADPGHALHDGDARSRQ